MSLLLEIVIEYGLRNDVDYLLQFSYPTARAKTTKSIRITSTCSFTHLRLATEKV